MKFMCINHNVVTVYISYAITNMGRKWMHNKEHIYYYIYWQQWQVCVCVCVCYIMVIGPMEPQLQAASSTKPGESHEWNLA